MNIPDYILLHCCGRGAYGEVWLAKDRTGRSVALKYLANSLASEKELTGLRNYAKLPDSPHLIRILHIGETDDGIFYTMELADCLYQDGHYTPVTLAYKLKLRSKFTPEETACLGIAITDGLIRLHQAGLIHRDIKPENILYVKGVPKLSDVGLVRSVEQTLSVGGTIGFIPPERLTPGSSKTGCASDDIYALGKVLYCTMTGCKVEDFPSFPPEMMQDPAGRAINKIILKACGPIENRFAGPEEFQIALQKALRIVPSCRKSWPVYPVILLLMLVSATAAFCFYPRKPETKTIIKEVRSGADTKALLEAGRERSIGRLLRIYKNIPRTTLGKLKNKLIEDMISNQYHDREKADMREELELIKKVLAQPAADGKKKTKEEEIFGGLECIHGIDCKVLDDGTILYHPKKEDALHLGNDFDVLDHSTRMAVLVCSAQDSQSREWDLAATNAVPDPSIKEREGTYRLKKRCRMSTLCSLTW